MTLPAAFPDDVAAFVYDLDGTLTDRGRPFTDRMVATIARSQRAGIPVLIATGRMYRSLRPYLEQAGIHEPAVCYQGAAVVRPEPEEWLFHAPIELDLAREAIVALEQIGYSPNVYVDDWLYVSTHTEYSRQYADFQNLPVTEVGDLAAWLTAPPTKLVTVGDPAALVHARASLSARFDGQLYVTTSLPRLLEIGHRGVSKGTGLRFVADKLGLDVERIVAFGDGENDVELLEEAGYGIAIEGGHPRALAVASATCPGPETEGVATAIDLFLDSLT